MKFNDTSDQVNSLYHHTLDLVGVDTNAYSTTQFARNANRHYYASVLDAWRFSGDWDFDDTNQSNFPIATTDLVDSQADYTIPTNALKIKRIEIKDSGGTWHLLKEIDDTQIDIALDEFQETDGVPRYYRLLRNSIILYPAPASASVTTTDGLKVYFLREIDRFASNDTTQEPGLPEPFHELISMGAAYDFAVMNGLDVAGPLKQELFEANEKMRQFFATRHEAFPRRFVGKKVRVH